MQLKPSFISNQRHTSVSRVLVSKARPGILDISYPLVISFKISRVVEAFVIVELRV